MKLGNISQTIVPVPNFFVERNYKTMETFDIYPKTNINNSKLKKIVKLNINSITQSSENSSINKTKEKERNHTKN